MAARLDLEEPFDPPSFIPVPKNPIFPRNAVDLSTPDRLAYQAAVASFAPLVEARRSEVVYSARLADSPKWFLRNGRDDWVWWRHDVVAAVRSDGPWMAETDITAYFDFIKHELLLPELLALGADHSIIERLREMLRVWGTAPNTGLPQGPNASRILGNFYLFPVDAAMEQFPAVRYFRYMDDIRIVGASRAAVIGALQVLVHECRRRGLALSTAKTSLHRGEDAIGQLEDLELDALQYAFDASEEDQDNLRRQLQEVFRASMKKTGQIDAAHARFSLGRLFRLRDKGVLTQVLAHLDDLAPLREIAPKYLHPWMMRPHVQRKLTEFLYDVERNTSAFLSAWLLAVMCDVPRTLPIEWIDYARTIACNRGEPTYHRTVALNVLALSPHTRDFGRIEDVVAGEHDPEVVRAALVALSRVGRLTKPIATRATRIPGMEMTVRYLSGAADLPSMVFASRRNARR